MLALGIILVLVAAGLLITALFGGRNAEEPAGFDLGAIHVDASTFTVFLAGALTLVILVLGLALIQTGMRRARRRRQERKELNRLTKKVEAQESAAPAETTTDTTPTAETTRTTETRTDTAVTDADRPRQ